MSELVAALIEPIKRWEGVVSWPYCDRHGFVTVGIGNLVRSPKHMATLPFVHPDGTPATNEEKELAYVKVQNNFVAKMSASFYAPLTSIRLGLDYMTNLVVERLEDEFIPDARKVFPDFDDWPLPARCATVDMLYSLGMGGYLDDYHNHKRHCEVRRFDLAALECHRKKEGEDAAKPETWKGRNLWTYNLYREASAVA